MNLSGKSEDGEPPRPGDKISFSDDEGSNSGSSTHTQVRSSGVKLPLTGILKAPMMEYNRDDSTPKPLKKVQITQKIEDDSPIKEKDQENKDHTSKDSISHPPKIGMEQAHRRQENTIGYFNHSLLVERDEKDHRNSLRDYNIKYNNLTKRYSEAVAEKVALREENTKLKKENEQLLESEELLQSKLSTSGDHKGGLEHQIRSMIDKTQALKSEIAKLASENMLLRDALEKATPMVIKCQKYEDIFKRGHEMSKALMESSIESDNEEPMVAQEDPKLRAGLTDIEHGENVSTPKKFSSCVPRELYESDSQISDTEYIEGPTRKQEACVDDIDLHEIEGLQNINIANDKVDHLGPRPTLTKPHHGSKNSTNVRRDNTNRRRGASDRREHDNGKQANQDEAKPTNFRNYGRGTQKFDPLQEEIGKMDGVYMLGEIHDPEAKKWMK